MCISEDLECGGGGARRIVRVGGRHYNARAAIVACIAACFAISICRVADAWLDIELAGAARRRQELKHGLTMIGGEKSDVPLPAAGSDRLHLWDAPPKLIFVGAGARPKVDGAATDECELRGGELIEWYGARMRFGMDPRAAAIPAPAAVAPPPLAPPSLTPQISGMPSRDEQMWRRLRAGMLVELGLGDGAATRRWQDAARRNEFEPDACARDLLGASAAADDERLLERTSSMLREMLLAPIAARRAEKRKKPKSMGCASMLIGQVLVFVVYGTVVAVLLFAVRQRWGWSVDGFLDSVIKRFT
jgi:hypothetical protein